MGRGVKRKKNNPGVGVDFKRVKTKVGKKLPKAQNETDTSFKAASINLPNQVLREEEKEGAAVNSHNLTLKVWVLCVHVCGCACFSNQCVPYKVRAGGSGLHRRAHV